jgi:hypothetical protein
MVCFRNICANTLHIEDDDDDDNDDVRCSCPCARREGIWDSRGITARIPVSGPILSLAA